MQFYQTQHERLIDESVLPSETNSLLHLFISTNKYISMKYEQGTYM